MADENVFLYLATYASEDDARADYEVLKDLHAAGVVGTYDAAIITVDDDGKVKVHKHEKPTQHAAWTGIGVGALVGIIFPVGLIAGAIVGGVTGGLVGHFWKGLSRSDVKELGEFLDEGDAALLVIGRDKLADTLDKELKRAERKLEKEVKADSKQLDKDLEEAEKDLEKS